MVAFLATQQQFQAQVNSSEITFIDFTAKWCGPCKQISPVFESLALSYKDLSTIKFFKVDVDDNEATAKMCGISSMPTFRVYQGGKLLEEFKGAHADRLKDFVGTYATPEIQRVALLKKPVEEMSVKELKRVIKENLGARVLAGCVDKEDLRREARRAQEESGGGGGGGGGGGKAAAQTKGATETAAARASGSSAASSSKTSAPGISVCLPHCVRLCVLTAFDSRDSTPTLSFPLQNIPGAKRLQIGPFKGCEVAVSPNIPLDWETSDAPVEVDLLVVALHGFGASAKEFTPLITPLYSSNKSSTGHDPLTLRVALASVQAATPPSMPFPAWFPLDEREMQMTFMQGEAAIAQMIRKELPGLKSARESVDIVLNSLCGAASSSSSGGGGGGGKESKAGRRSDGKPFFSLGAKGKLCLVGFSQGAVLAVDRALALPRVDGLLSWSAFPVTVDQWYAASQKSGLLSKQRKLRAVWSHGAMDPRIPLAVGKWVFGMLERCGVEVKNEEHRGGHDLGTNGIGNLTQLMKWVMADFPARDKPLPKKW